MSTHLEGSNVRGWQVWRRQINYNSKWKRRQRGERPRGKSSRSLRLFRVECDKGSFGIKTTKDLGEPVVGRHISVVDLRPGWVTKNGPQGRSGRRGEEVPVHQRREMTVSAFPDVKEEQVA